MPHSLESMSHWARLLSDAWGIQAVLAPLPGEYDLNFAATAGDGRRYVLKVMRQGCDAAFVELLVAGHAQVARRAPALPVPRVVPTVDGAAWATRSDPLGEPRLAWLLTTLDGAHLARVRPHPARLVAELGGRLAELDLALAGLEHPLLDRALKWDLRQAGWITAELSAIADPGRRALVESIVARYAALVDAVRREPVTVIHNDINDYNLLVAHDDRGAPHLSAILDFGDMIRGPVVCELAIAAAYVALGHDHPERAVATLVGHYHERSPLTAAQVDLIWPLTLMRLAVSVTNSALMQRERPDDPYVVVSERPAWRLLEQAAGLSEPLVNARLRTACGLPATDAARRTATWMQGARGTFAPVLGGSLAHARVGDLSTVGCAVPRDPFAMTLPEAATLGALAMPVDNAARGPQPGPAPDASTTWLGRYGEPRLVYTAPAFRAGPHRTCDRRTVHLGVDVFMPAGTPVHAPLDGVVEVVEYRAGELDYGGMVILAHVTPDGDRVSTLYGHLARDVVARLAPGQHVARGAAFATLGGPMENGGWDPHLHFQLALLTTGMEADWPGVADPDEFEHWRAVCPNPAALLNLPDERVAYRPLDAAGIAAGRTAHFAANLRLSYAEPLLFVRGWRHHLFDEWGRPHLDAYNNVPHVGHAHPRIQAVAADQLRRLNSNTRYLHPAQVAFAQALLAKVPSHLTHVFLVNSGSEANELALRLSRARTGARDMITMDHGYHGNTTGAIDLSPYKFNKPGGGGAPAWVQVVPVADPYRGTHRGAESAAAYAAHVDDAVARIVARGGRLAGFIAETFPSVGGQIIPPAGYLNAVYAKVRAAGGVCIADEVQTGLGRLGAYYWGFEQQAAHPDLVVLGKPLGNGHPMGAVLTTAEIARSFDNGIEFFSTFGGSTLSCRIGTEVLQIVDDEGLQGNARERGDQLLHGLRALQSRHAVVGDVRGIGLFVGVDLVTNRDSRAPATRAARYVTNRLREERILVGTEGPADNVLKIRPPLTVEPADIDHLLATLDRVLAESPVRAEERG